MDVEGTEMRVAGMAREGSSKWDPPFVLTGGDTVIFGIGGEAEVARLEVMVFECVPKLEKDATWPTPSLSNSNKVFYRK